jgi:aldehyde dehydrogenase
MSGFFDLLNEFENASAREASAGSQSRGARQDPKTLTASDTGVGSVLMRADNLRTALAVRQWVKPNLLLPSDLAEADRRAILDVVAPDVETSSSQHPGEWYLHDDVRRDILTKRSADVLRAALYNEILENDASDPVRRALCARLQPLPDSLMTFTAPALRALQASLNWLSPRDRRFDGETDQENFWCQESDPRGLRERIAAVLERKRRDEDVARMSATDLFDRVSILDRLVALATRPRVDNVQGQWVYLSGIGGSGKSTIFAHLEKQISALPSPLLVLHLDCDEPGFDPTDVLALDISLFRQLGVAVPSEAPYLRYRVAALAEVGEGADASYMARTSAKRTVPGPSKKRHRAVLSSHVVQSFEGLEMAVSERASGRASISWNALQIVTAGQPLVLLVDTAELIFARGQDATQIFAGWAASLVQMMGAFDVRMVVAGRDPPDAPGPRGLEGAMATPPQTDLTRSQTSFWRQDPTLIVGDLGADQADAMLKGLGVDDQVLRSKAARVLPGTPLVLRLAAEAYMSGEESRRDFVTSIDNDAIDPAVASRYLAERVVRHLSSAVARAYVLGAMVLPQLTQQLVTEVVMPAVSPKGSAASASASDIFDGLGAAGWLVRVSGDGGRLIFHTEMRRLVLELLEADPENFAMMQRVRDKARNYYSARRDAESRTFFAYFDALLGGGATNRSFSALTPAVLGAAIEDLDPADRDRLFGDAALSASGTSIRAGTYQATESDREWRARLEGTGSRDGEGDRLVKRNRAADALRLYRDRPTRKLGLPPTFVLQALADNAEWQTNEVDVDGIIEELRNDRASKGGAGVNAIRSRLYWLTRYELLRSPHGLGDSHMRLLRDEAFSTSGRGPVLLYPGVLALAEAIRQGTTSFAPEAWFSAHGAIESETRLFLVEHLCFGRSVRFRPHLDALLVTQPDWPARARAILSVMQPPSTNANRTRVEFPQLDSVAAFLRREHGEELDLPGLNSWLRSLRRPIDVMIDRETAPEDVIFLLRGLTSEVHRPLRASVSRLAAAEPDRRRDLAEIVRRCAAGFGVCPREFAAEELEARIARDISGVFAILIPYADRSRRLQSLCEDLLSIGAATPDSRVVTDVAQVFLAWDKALCAGRNSAYPSHSSFAVAENESLASNVAIERRSSRTGNAASFELRASAERNGGKSRAAGATAVLQDDVELSSEKSGQPQTTSRAPSNVRVTDRVAEGFFPGPFIGKASLHGPPVLGGLFRNKFANFIGGKWVAPVRGQYFDNISPVSGQVLCQVARSTAEDVELALDAAHKARESWGRTTPAERANILNKIADRIEENLATIALVETLDNGKPIRETTYADIPLAVDHFRYFAGVLRAQEGSNSEIDRDTIAYHFHEPLGVVGQIIPWNFPLLMAAWKLAPALAAGNCIVLKPAEQTPVGILVLLELIEDLLPDGVLNVVNGFGAEAGRALGESKRIAKMAFTGSTVTGRTIAHYAADNLIPATLELSGKSPNIFFADVIDEDDDFFDKALEGFAMFALNQGEVGGSPSRALVDAGIYDRFMERAIARVQKIKQGNPLDMSTMIGAQVSNDQLQKILNYIEIGKQEGANLLTGGTRANLGGELEGGYYITPTVFEGHNKMRIFQEEIFGPVLSVTKFNSEEEALAIANDTHFGLGAGVWTRNGNRAYRFGRAIQAGRVWINCYHAYPAHAAFGGYKESGIGRETHKMVLDRYQQTKNLLVSYSAKALGFF